MEFENILHRSESAYLKDAAEQPVHWQIFCDEAFNLAKELDRPILLDIGAVWCHWCHVMDHESYSDKAVADLINKLFVPIKVDRDQMPDVDARYQSAIGAMTGGGGWPLTGFLTPEGKAFYGGTYIPKNDMDGKPGMLSLLPQIAEIYATRREEVLKSADEVVRYLRDFESKTAILGELDEKIADRILKSITDNFDPEFGGLGKSPKFFNATALMLLEEEAVRTGDKILRNMIDLSLERISQGGVCDQMGGGFHRYSVDRYWHVPHFEKMLYDNALLLSVYLKNYEATRVQMFRDTAYSTAEWISGRMRSTQGPFYAHEDADVGPGDDGSYWTWTEGEVREALEPEEFDVLSEHFDIRKMPHDIHEMPERNVLRVAVSPRDMASGKGKSEEEIIKLILSARRKLLSIRDQRIPPFIDKTFLSDRNGLAISALVEASLVLKERKYLKFASEAAAFILREMVDDKGKVAHAFSGEKVVYGGLLDDQVYFGISLLDLFDVMRSDEHIHSAEKIAQVLLDDFEDKESGGFLDRPANSLGKGLLANSKKPIDDTPTPSGNSGAALFLDRLFLATDNGKYYQAAEKTLKAFAGSADTLSIYVANYARALRFHLRIRKNVK